MTFKTATLLILPVTMLAACRTAPEPEPVYIPPPEVRTCFEQSELTLVTIPEETEVFYAITEIENPPYEPIQRREKQVRVVKDAYTIFQDAQGNEVASSMICDNELVSDPVSGQNGFLPQGARDLTQ